MSSSTPTAKVRFVTNDSPRRATSQPVPTNPVSAEALEFLGFIKPVAESIYARWVTRPNPETNHHDLVDYACGNLESLNTPELLALSPAEALDAVGLNAEMKDALLDPEFSQIFFSQNLLYWVQDTLRLRYKSLLMISERKSQAKHPRDDEGHDLEDGPGGGQISNDAGLSRRGDEANVPKHKDQSEPGVLSVLDGKGSCEEPEKRSG